jgi:hypothetical protein
LAACWSGRGAALSTPLPLDDSGRFNFALCHFLREPNIVNLSIVFSSRIRGIAGGIAAFAGLFALSMPIMMLLARGFLGFAGVI